MHEKNFAIDYSYLNQIYKDFIKAIGLVDKNFVNLYIIKDNKIIIKLKMAIKSSLDKAK